MSVTIFEVLQNAQINFDGQLGFQKEIAKEQLANVITALENGYDVYEDFDENMLTQSKADV